MRNRLSISALLLMAVVFFSSCTKDNAKGALTEITPSSGIIVNFGQYNGAKSTLSFYDGITQSVINNYFKSVNDFNLLSNIQYAYKADSTIYFMNNNVDEVLYVSAKDLKQVKNAISGADIVKPRNCVAYNNILYVSCWDGEPWTDATLGKIVKIDMKTNTIIGSITMPGGPEGLEVSNGKLYAALNYDTKIAVIDLITESVSYIYTPAKSSYLKKDNMGNIYVSLISYTATETGIGYINTVTDEITVYEIDGVSTSYVSVLEFSKDYSKLYVLQSAWNTEIGGYSGSVAVFNTATKALEPQNLVSDLNGINGVDVDEVGGKIMVFISNGGSTNGIVKIYNDNGTYIKDVETGINPFMYLSLK